jgi:hypothetical protein
LRREEKEENVLSGENRMGVCLHFMREERVWGRRKREGEEGRGRRRGRERERKREGGTRIKSTQKPTKKKKKNNTNNITHYEKK